MCDGASKTWPCSARARPPITTVFGELEQTCGQRITDPGRQKQRDLRELRIVARACSVVTSFQELGCCDRRHGPYSSNTSAIGSEGHGDLIANRLRVLIGVAQELRRVR